MPFVEHNNPELKYYIDSEAEKVRTLIRKLRFVIEKGQIDPPPYATITELGKHSWILTNAIKQFTIRHDYMDNNEKLKFSTYEDVISFVNKEANSNRQSIMTESAGEVALYYDLGFSKQEYEDLILWKKNLLEIEFNCVEAFNAFSDQIIKDIMNAQSKIKLKNIVPGLAGIVGIATDVAFFSTSLAIPALISSCTTGFSAIALNFPEVRKKLLAKGK